MDTTLAKIVVLVAFYLCDVISLPLNEKNRLPIGIRVEKSAVNHLSFEFGVRTPFGVPNPRLRLEEPLNDLRNFRRPVHRDGNNMRQAPINERYENIETTTIMHIPKTLDNPPSVSPSSRINLEINKNEYSSSTNNNEPKINTNTKITISEKDNPSVSLTGAEFTATEMKNTKKEELFKKIDKNLLDYIFQINTTTANSSVDSTTETGDYETTTYEGDELLRIPGAVVASLLG